MCSCIECIGDQPEPPALEEELIDLLAIMFDAYEEGPDCYEDPDDCSGHLGKAVKLDDASFDRIADILNKRRPRNQMLADTPKP